VAPYVPPNQVIFLKNVALRFIRPILGSLGVNATIDENLLEDVAAFFLRDIYRIDRQQKESISAAKFAGYWGF